MSAERIVLVHLVKDESTNVKFYDLMDNFKFGFSLVASYVGVFLVALLVGFILSELKRKMQFGATIRAGLRWRRAAVKKRTMGLKTRIDWALRRFSVNRLSSISIFILFVNLFLWFTQLFLINNTKTNKVVRLVASWS